VVLQNWRMVAAAADITDEQKAAITADIEKMVQSASWQEVLKQKNWANTFLAGDAFARASAEHHADQGSADPDRPGEMTDAPQGATERRRPDRAALVIAAGLALLAAVVAWNTRNIGGGGGYAQIGPKAFPYAIAIMLAVLSAFTLLSAGAANSRPRP
jgi:hypothetical protein